jgi:hypothetical protein
MESNILDVFIWFLMILLILFTILLILGVLKLIYDLICEWFNL